MGFKPDFFAPACAQLVSKGFLAGELARDYLGHARPLRILFSNRDGWVELLARKFRFTRHQIAFGDVRQADLDAYDIVVPLAMDDLRYLSHAPPGLHSLIPIPSPTAIELCDDKLAFHRHLAGRGFGRWLPRIDAALAPPYVVKRNPDEAGAHCHIVTSAEAERALPPECAQPDYFRQEFVPGRREYACHILFKGGRIVHALTIEYGYATDYPIKGRNATEYMLLRRCAWLALFADMLRALEFEGLCCVNYKLRDGEPVVLEINPRLGRSATGYFFAFLRHLERA